MTYDDVNSPRLRALVALLMMCALLLGCQSALVANPSGNGPEATLTNDAEELLDQWRGQSELLHQAAEKLFLALQKNRGHAKAYMQLGRLHIMGGQSHLPHFGPSSLEGAEHAIKKALELDPKYADAYVLLGHLYTITDRLAQAKVALRTAEGLGTSSPWLAINWAISDSDCRFRSA